MTLSTLPSSLPPHEPLDLAHPVDAKRPPASLELGNGEAVVRRPIEPESPPVGLQVQSKGDSKGPRGVPSGDFLKQVDAAVDPFLLPELAPIVSAYLDEGRPIIQAAREHVAKAREALVGGGFDTESRLAIFQKCEEVLDRFEKGNPIAGDFAEVRGKAPEMGQATALHSMRAFDRELARLEEGMDVTREALDDHLPGKLSKLVMAYANSAHDAADQTLLKRARELIGRCAEPDDHKDAMLAYVDRLQQAVYQSQTGQRVKMPERGGLRVPVDVDECLERIEWPLAAGLAHSDALEEPGSGNEPGLREAVDRLAEPE